MFFLCLCVNKRCSLSARWGAPVFLRLRGYVLGLSMFACSVFLSQLLSNGRNFVLDDFHRCYIEYCLNRWLLKCFVAVKRESVG